MSAGAGPLEPVAPVGGAGPIEPVAHPAPAVVAVVAVVAAAEAEACGAAALRRAGHACNCLHRRRCRDRPRGRRRRDRRLADPLPSPHPRGPEGGSRRHRRRRPHPLGCRLGGPTGAEPGHRRRPAHGSTGSRRASRPGPTWRCGDPGRRHRPSRSARTRTIGQIRLGDPSAGASPDRKVFPAPGGLLGQEARRARRRTRSRSTRWTTPPGCARGYSGCSSRSTRNPRLIERGALNFVIVGGGPTGVEVAGAIADMLNVTAPAVYHGFDAGAAQIHLLDYGDALLKPFSDSAHSYVAKVLRRKACGSTWAPASRRWRPATRCSRTAARSRLAAWSGAAASRPRPSRRTVVWPRDAEAASTSRPTSRWPGTTAPMWSATSPTSLTGRSASPARLGRAAERQLGGEEHPGRRGGQASRAVRLSRQGHHGHDRPWRRDRRGGQASP